VTRARLACGFTLIEVLIAMAITAVVAGLALASLTAALDATERLDVQAQRSQEITRALRILSRDLESFVPRPVRDEFGDSEPSLFGGRGSAVLLAFSRGGWHHRGEQPRSDLQRVQYRLLDGVLWRETFTVLDRVGTTEPVRLALLTDVEFASLRFLAGGTPVSGTRLDTERWPEEWAVNRFNNPETTQVPRALEIRLELADWGELRRLYALPGE